MEHILRHGRALLLCRCSTCGLASDGALRTGTVSIRFGGSRHRKAGPPRSVKAIMAC